LASVAVANLVLSLALTPELGLEGPALGTAIPFALAFPVLIRIGLRVSGASLAELALRAWLPAYALGAALAAALVALRLVAEPSSLPAVAGAGAAGVLVYWVAFYALWLDAGERALVRGLFRGRREPRR
jgi:hypothetical protein